MNPNQNSGIKQLHARGYALWPGVAVQTILGEIDPDDSTPFRSMPAGSVGWIDSANLNGDGLCEDFNVYFESRSAIGLTRTELDNTTRYQLLPPKTVLHLALYLKHGLEVASLTMFDDAMLAAAERMVSSYEAVIALSSDRRIGYAKPTAISICSSPEQLHAAMSKALASQQLPPLDAGHPAP